MADYPTGKNACKQGLLNWQKAKAGIYTLALSPMPVGKIAKDSGDNPDSSKKSIKGVETEMTSDYWIFMILQKAIKIITKNNEEERKVKRKEQWWKIFFVWK